MEALVLTAFEAGIMRQVDQMPAGCSLPVTNNLVIPYLKGMFNLNSVRIFVQNGKIGGIYTPAVDR